MTTPMPTSPFTEDHGRVLLTTLTTLDQRFAQTDAQIADLRVSAWTKVLAEVDPRFAMWYIQRAYSDVRDYQLQVGEILQAWRKHAAEEREAADRAEADLDEPMLVGDTSMMSYVRDVLEAVQAGRTVESVPKPAVMQTITPAADQRARRCVYWDLCSCDHTKCRAGWLDAEGEVVNGLGRRYAAVVRCPACEDGIKMAEELGRAKRPSYTGKRR